MSDPVRVQLSRKKGWKMPPNTVSVARPGRWGNPFKVGVDGDAKECIAKFVQQLLPYRHGGTMLEYGISEASLHAIEFDLSGKNLACWCPLDQPCHADVLLELANTHDTTQRSEKGEGDEASNDPRR
jgi:hypothetical protein